MTNIDPAIVEALTEWWASLCDDPDDAAFVRAAHETAEEAAAYAAALTPTLAAAVDAARAEAWDEGYTAGISAPVNRALGLGNPANPYREATP